MSEKNVCKITHFPSRGWSIRQAVRCETLTVKQLTDRLLDGVEELHCLMGYIKHHDLPRYDLPYGFISRMKGQLRERPSDEELLCAGQQLADALGGIERHLLALGQKLPENYVMQG